MDLRREFCIATRLVSVDFERGVDSSRYAEMCQVNIVAAYERRNSSVKYLH